MDIRSYQRMYHHCIQELKDTVPPGTCTMTAVIREAPHPGSVITIFERTRAKQLRCLFSVSVLMTIVLVGCMFVPFAMISIGKKNKHDLMCIAFLLIFVEIQSCMHFLGVKHLEDCPKEPYIPIYLLVGGCTNLLKIMSLLWRQMKQRQLEKLEENTEQYREDLQASNSTRCSDFILSVFLVIWFICGNYWVFSIYKPEFDQPLLDPRNWCDRGTYMFALVQVIACYCLLALVLCVCALLAICYRLTDSDNDQV